MSYLALNMGAEFAWSMTMTATEKSAFLGVQVSLARIRKRLPGQSMNPQKRDPYHNTVSRRPLNPDLGPLVARVVNVTKAFD